MRVREDAMISAGQVSMKASDAAERAVERVIDDFEVTPNSALYKAAYGAAMDQLRGAKEIDNNAKQRAIDAARSEFVKAGFNPIAQPKVSGRIQGTSLFGAESPLKVAKREIPNDNSGVRQAAAELLGAAMDADSKRERLYGIIDSIVA
jgi:hypothetical protein